MNNSTLLSEDWLKSGIGPGDTILLHSDLRRLIFNYKKRGLTIRIDEILNSFIETLGKEGTLILPTFNFGFLHGHTFDINNTISETGLLSEFARKLNVGSRTNHPVYSFYVIGRHEKLFKNLSNLKSYSDDSPFGLLKKLNGNIAVLGLDDQDCMTYYHHIEETNKVNYRFSKEFTGTIIDEKGLIIKKTISIYVRDINKGVVTHLNPAGELLWKNGLYVGYRPHEGTGLRVINAQKMFDFVTKEIIHKNKAEGLLYRIDN